MQEDYSCDLNKLPTSKTLRETICAIREMFSDGQTLADVREVHMKFCQKYPKLVDKLMEPDMNQEQLSYILSMFDRVQQRSTSYEQASQTIGKSMFDKFVAPDLTPSQLERVQKRMEELQTHSPEELAQAAAQLGQSAVSKSESSAQLSQSKTNDNKNVTGGSKKKLRKLRENNQEGDYNYIFREFQFP